MEAFLIKSRIEPYANTLNLTRIPTEIQTQIGKVLALNSQLHPTIPLRNRNRKPNQLNMNLNNNATNTTTTTTTTTTETSASATILYQNNETTMLTENSSFWLNHSVLLNFSSFNGSELLFDYGGDGFNLDLELQKNGTDTFAISEPWSYCNEWATAQHTMFQTANLFFAAAFLVPHTFKQSVLLVRALLTFGFLFSTIWAGHEVCALDIMLWNVLLVTINFAHTVQLTWRFLPPTLTVELTELYLKVFKPLRVSKKHFKELVREAQVVNLEKGDIYAVEDVSPADERLSILLKGKLRVTCDDTHLHFINAHQFVDSPEWEANHDQSDDVFQVTITAEEDSVYLCWPRMKLERVLRHRPMLKTVLDSIIGKDITQKLYSLNEHLSGVIQNRADDKRKSDFRNLHSRSLSLDAVNTGTTGKVRSLFYKTNQRKPSFSSSGYGSPARAHNQCWVPVVANHFPVESPFTAPPPPPQPPPQTQPVVFYSMSISDPEYSPINSNRNQQQRSSKKSREVTFVNEVEKIE